MSEDSTISLRRDLLRSIATFRDLDDAVLTELSQHSVTRRLEKGSVVFREGERPQALHYLVAGQVKRSVCNTDGDEKVIEVFLPKHFIGDAELFSERLCRSRAEATCDGVLLSIGKEALLALVGRSPEIGLKLLKALADRHYMLEQDIVTRRFQSTADRVLDYLCDRVVESDGETAIVNLGTSKQVMASHLDMSPETLSRNLRRLMDAELINVCGRRVRIHLRALAAHQNSGGDHGLASPSCPGQNMSAPAMR